MQARQLGTRFGNAARNVFTPEYLNHVTQVAKAQGLTIGEHPAFSSSNPETRVPWISAVAPQRVGRVQNLNSWDYHRLVPSLPFYKGERIPSLGGIENLIDPYVGQAITTVKTAAAAQTIGMVTIVALLLVLLIRS